MRATTTPVIHSTVVDEAVLPLDTSTALVIPSPPVVSTNVRLNGVIFGRAHVVIIA